MKIANVLRRFSFQEWGGTESAVWNASKELASMGNSVEIISTTALSTAKNDRVNSIPIKRFSYFYPHVFLDAAKMEVLDKKGGNPFSLGIFRELMRGDFDIIHTHAMGRLAKEAVKAARMKKIPCVISFHGGNYDVPQSEFDEMAKPLKGTLGYGGALERLLGLRYDIVEKADGIICVGKNEFDEIKRRFPKKHAALIPNGVYCEKFEKTPHANFRAAYGIPADRKLILCVSRIDYQKNQIAMAGLVKNLVGKGENVHCAIVGFVTSKSYCERLLGEIENAGLKSRFTIVEGLPPDSDMLLSAYKSADIFALPSVHEPFGIVVIEAWCAGVPVIASKVGGLAHLIEDGKNGCLFDASSESQMADAYFRALGNKDSITEYAKAEVQKKYSWRGVAEMTANFYKELIHAK